MRCMRIFLIPIVWGVSSQFRKHTVVKTQNLLQDQQKSEKNPVNHAHDHDGLSHHPKDAHSSVHTKQVLLQQKATSRIQHKAPITQSARTDGKLTTAISTSIKENNNVVKDQHLDKSSEKDKKEDAHQISKTTGSKKQSDHPAEQSLKVVHIQKEAITTANKSVRRNEKGTTLIVRPPVTNSKTHSEVKEKDVVRIEVLRNSRTGTCVLHGVMGPKLEDGKQSEFFCLTTKKKIIHHTITGILKLNQRFDTKLKCHKCLGDFYPIQMQEHPPLRSEYGPENCIHSYPSVDKTCIVETKNCSEESVLHTNVGFFCLRLKGRNEKHFFGIHSFASSQKVDTRIKCDQCLSSDTSIMHGEEHIVDHHLYLNTQSLWLLQMVSDMGEEIKSLSEKYDKIDRDKKEFLQERKHLSLALKVPAHTASIDEDLSGGGVDLSEW